MNINEMVLGASVRISGHDVVGVVEQLNLDEETVLVIVDGPEDESTGMVPGFWMNASDVEKA